MTVYFRDKPAIPFPAWLRKLGFEDNSYGNDFAARATFKRADGFVVYVWCAEPKPYEEGSADLSRREPDQPRYSVHIADSEDEMCSPSDARYSGEDWKQARKYAVDLVSFVMPEIEHLAAVFSDRIRAALTPKQLKRVNYLNHPSRRPQGSCASQDVIDANDCMIAALTQCSGLKDCVLASSQRWTDMINNAWEFALVSGFSLTAQQ